MIPCFMSQSIFFPLCQGVVRSGMVEKTRVIIENHRPMARELINCENQFSVEKESYRFENELDV